VSRDDIDNNYIDRIVNYYRGNNKLTLNNLAKGRIYGGANRGYLPQKSWSEGVKLPNNKWVNYSIALILLTLLRVKNIQDPPLILPTSSGSRKTTKSRFIYYIDNYRTGNSNYYSNPPATSTCTIMWFHIMYDNN
jgi:hypothetical protein